MSDENINQIKDISSIDSVIPIGELISEIALKVKKIKSKSHFVIKYSWLIINMKSSWCKWYCMKNDNIPHICNKWESCKNFSKANSIINRISNFKEKELLESLY